MTLRWPRPLRPGDTVAVVSPCGPCDEQGLTRGCEQLRAWGLEVRVAPHVLDVSGYLAGDDGARAADFTAAWADEGVAAVLASRGGYGAMRMVDLVDWDRLASAPPKLLVGFSDVTVLHLAVARHLGVGSVYGPNVGGLPADAESLERYRDQLLGGGHFAPLPGTWGQGGSVTGPLHGGCLSLLASTVGSPLADVPDGAVVFLEDVHEEPYRIDRLLTQLRRAGWFDRAGGVALGTWTDCGDPQTVLEVLHDRLDPLGLPMVGGLPAGHGPRPASLPLGRTVTLDGPAAVLSLLPPSSGRVDE